MNIYGVKIEIAFPVEIFQRLLQGTRSEERREISSFRHKADAERALVSCLLRDSLLGKTLGVEPSHIRYYENEYGKPFVEGRGAIHFNLSHSGSWVVMALDSQPLGIDVEQVKEVDLNIAEKYFSLKEREYLFGLEEVCREGSFYDLWTLKEAYIKAVGKGLQIPLDSFSVIPASNGEFMFFEGDRISEKYQFKQYTIDNGYRLSVCSLNRNFPGNIEFLRVKDIV
jgi:4'-phosphopantetheinyl transferase